MGIYIPGMEMPKNCFDCPCCNGENGYCNIRNKYVYDEVPRSCPLVPVPKHGRLIDADALYKEALERSETKDGYYNCLDHVISCYTIDQAPTIIPPSEEATP